ncbi:CSC1-like protein 1 [Bagarius yarrelli]|uniref:CSC1-like protein 1 n=1 Tax=Bagarius yarrelli TaxID=175774 RepID=A0A556V8E6_BAGYA|nr:CSC1-like protein 1 [Bagarius yarrelli]
MIGEKNFVLIRRVVKRATEHVYFFSFNRKWKGLKMASDLFIDARNSNRAEEQRRGWYLRSLENCVHSCSPRAAAHRVPHRVPDRVPDRVPYRVPYRRTGKKPHIFNVRFFLRSCETEFSVTDKVLNVGLPMASAWWERLSTLVENNTMRSDNSCSSVTQNKLLMDVTFGGVPIVLLLDFIVFLMLLLVFTSIRKKLWDYGRLALVAETEGINETSRRRYGRMTSFMSIEEQEHERGVCSWLTFIITMDEAYPSCKVKDIRLCYDVAKLIHLLKKRKRAEKNLLYYRKILDSQGRQEVVHPRLCGHLCICCPCQGCKGSSVCVCVCVCVCAVSSLSILKDFNAFGCGGGSQEMGRVREITCGCQTEPQPSSTSEELKVKQWSVSYATHPNNIIWQNLSMPRWLWWSRYLLLNTLLFIMLFFLTTPSIFISIVEKLNVTKPIERLNSAVISQFLPTLLLWFFSALSSENMSMMYKLYIFLLFMVLILPSLGLTSLDVFFQQLFNSQSQQKLQFECVFLPDQGAFFVNYVIAAALIGSGMELLRLPNLLLYTVRMACARSAAERKYVKQNQAYQFEYGAMYGWTLCVFTVIMAYSITCPVIAPFGFLYIILKHLVDKHNLYFAYLPARLDRQVHLGAVNQALAAPIICLFWLYFFSVLRTGLKKIIDFIPINVFDVLNIVSSLFELCPGFMAPTSLFTLVVVCVTIFIGISYTCFGHFKYLSPHNYVVYLPKVLHPEETSGCPAEVSHPPSYGTADASPAVFGGLEELCD